MINGLNYNMISKLKIQQYTIYILIMITAIQYSSIGVDDSVYNGIRLLTTLIIFVSILFNAKSIVNSIFRERIILLHFIFAFLFFAIIIIFSIIDSKVTISPFREFIMSLFFISLGYSMKLDDNKLYRIFNFFVIAFTISAISIILKFSTGFQIPNSYLPIPKNQFAPVFAIALMLSLYHWGKRSKAVRIISAFCFVILLMSLLVIRSRSSILSSILIVLIYTMYYLPSIKYRLYGFIGLVIGAVFLSPKIYQALFANYDTNSIESVSAGRVDVYLKGLEFLTNNPLGGSLQGIYVTDSYIHNYLLFNIVNYGVIISLPLVFTYFYYLLISLRAIKKNTFQSYDCIPLMMIIIFISSLFEYTFPFGPGTAIIFPFLFLGVYLNRIRSY